MESLRKEAGSTTPWRLPPRAHSKFERTVKRPCRGSRSALRVRLSTPQVSSIPDLLADSMGGHQKCTGAEGNGSEMTKSESRMTNQARNLKSE